MGKAWRYGDNVDTDVIIPARYLTATDPSALAAHALEDLDPSFAADVRPGDVVVAGHNFGCGSSREHAPIALMGAGVAAVVAKSFARIFFRNAINTGLPVLVCPAAVDAMNAGDELEVDADAGEIRNASTGIVYTAEPLPEFVLEIVRAGGLVEWVRRRRRGFGGTSEAGSAAGVPLISESGDVAVRQSRSEKERNSGVVA